MRIISRNFLIASIVAVCLTTLSGSLFAKCDRTTYHGKLRYVSGRADNAHTNVSGTAALSMDQTQFNKLKRLVGQNVRIVCELCYRNFGVISVTATKASAIVTGPVAERAENFRQLWGVPASEAATDDGIAPDDGTDVIASTASTCRTETSVVHSVRALGADAVVLNGGKFECRLGIPGKLKMLKGRKVKITFCMRTVGMRCIDKITAVTAL